MKTLRIIVRTPIFRMFFLLSAFILSTGCATVIKGTTQGVPISSDPSGAEVIVDGMLVGTTPTNFEFKRKTDHLVVIEKKGYAPKSVPVVKNIGGAVWGNIIAGGLIGWGVDAASGAQNNLTPKTIFVTLEPVGEGGLAADSGLDASAGIKKLNDLDQMRENEQISDEEYTKARIAVIEEYFPEMIPEPDDAGSDESAGTEPDQ